MKKWLKRYRKIFGKTYSNPYKKKAADALPEMTVDGLKKFVDAGFGTLAKMKVPGKSAGDKRKQQNKTEKKKTEPAVKKTKVGRLV